MGGKDKQDFYHFYSLKTVWQQQIFNEIKASYIVSGAATKK